MTNKPPLRILFAGTPEFAARHLSGLLDSRHELVAVYTQPDRRAGRGKKRQASPVKQLAEQLDIPVFQPPSLKNEEAQRTLADLNVDVMVVVAYGLILPQAVLDAPRIACLNVHASLLPRWRGAAPIQRAIEAGDPETGLTIMQMDAGLDTGKMLAKCRCPIDKATTAGSLHDELANLGLPLLLEVLDSLPEKLAAGQEQQNELATYAAKILKTEAEIRWGEGADLIARKIRAFNPFPVSYTFIGNERLKIHSAQATGTDTPGLLPGTILPSGPAEIIIACGSGQLSIDKLQLPGGKAMSTEQMLHAKSALFTSGIQLRIAAEPC